MELYRFRSLSFTLEMPPMVTKPTYEELKQRVRELEQESARLKQTEEEIRHRLGLQGKASMKSSPLR
jgi:regulator of replication initiation timing